MRADACYTALRDKGQAPVSLYVHAFVASLKHGSRRRSLSPMHYICKLMFSAKAAAWLSPLHDEERLYLQMNDWTLVS